MIIIIGHGGFSGETFVPLHPLPQKLLLQTHRGALLPLQNLLIAMETGGEGAVRTLGAGKHEDRIVENYTLSPLQEQIRKKLKRFTPAGARILLVGSPEWNSNFPSSSFCSSPQQCPPGANMHFCDGILSKMQGKEWLLLACSQQTGKSVKPTVTMDQAAVNPFAALNSLLTDDKEKFRSWISSQTPDALQVRDLYQNTNKKYRQLLRTDLDIDAIMEVTPLIIEHLKTPLVSEVILFSDAVDRLDGDIKDYILNQPIVRDYVGRHTRLAADGAIRAQKEFGLKGLLCSFGHANPETLSETCRSFLFSPLPDDNAATMQYSSLQEDLKLAFWLNGDFSSLSEDTKLETWKDYGDEVQTFMRTLGYVPPQKLSDSDETSNES
ncbi:hypothetical protein ACTVZO_39670 [Streptomyces sp. IBSNAI002]|uniref:hypothetical protein n=1 Tax=Streptomyces sp. IBSNAI002 TaxID=3457500 RepID=UPI003FD24CDC